MSNWNIVVGGSAKDLESVYGFKVEQMMGAGMPPIDNIFLEYALIDGGLFQRQKIKPRTFTLVGTLSGSSLSDLHQKRAGLISLFRPDRTTTAITFRYNGSGTSLQASAIYDGGLEIGTIDANREAHIALRFLQLDPYWESAAGTSASLQTQGSMTVGCMARRAACGQWDNMLGGVAFEGALTSAYTITELIAGSAASQVIVGGWFTRLHDTVSSSTVASNVGLWNVTKWQAYGTVNGVVSAMKRSPAGRLYIGGDFQTTSSGSVGGTASWNGSAWVRTEASFLGGTQVLGMEFYGDEIYYVGTFASAVASSGGNISAKYAALVNTRSGQVRALDVTSSSGLSGWPTDIVKTKSGSIILFGDFSASITGGSVVSSLVAYNKSSCVLFAPTAFPSPLSSSTAGSIVYGFIEGADGKLYAAGNFDTVNQNTTIASNVAVFDYVNFQPLAMGWPNALAAIFKDKFGNPTVADSNGTAGNYYPWGATWLAGAWTNTYGINFGREINNVLNSAWGDQYYCISALGSAGSGTASHAGFTAVNVGGTQDVYPIISATGPGLLVEVRNFTTGHNIWLNYNLAASEVVTMDLSIGAKTIESSVASDISYAIQPGSDFSAFKLTPGVNAVSCWITGGQGKAGLGWNEKYWSVDGAS